MSIGRFNVLLILGYVVAGTGCPGSVGDPVPPPPAPSNLTVTAKSSSRIDVEWTDNSITEYGFRIFRSEDGGATFVQVAEVGSNVVLYKDLGLLPLTSYQYKVLSFNPSGESALIGPSGDTTTALVWSGPFTGGPGARGDHTAIYDGIGHQMVVFGGFDMNLGPVNETWSLDISSVATTWSQLSPLIQTSDGLPPIERFGHSAVFDSVNRRMIVFGGMDINGGFLNDVYILTLGTTIAWKTPTIVGTFPVARMGHCAVYDQGHQRMIVFGGEDASNNFLSDTFALSLSGNTFTWTKLASNTPIQRRESAMVVGTPGTELLLYGGFDNITTNDGTFLNGDQWTFSLGSLGVWSPFPAAGSPPPRSGHTAIYDSFNQRAIVYGGNLSDSASPAVPTSELWGVLLYNPGSWRKDSVTSGSVPPVRLAHSAIYDENFKRMIIFGGNDSGGFAAYDDLWILDF